MFFFSICTELQKTYFNFGICLITIVNSTVGIKNALGWGARALQINNTFAHARGPRVEINSG